jgi:hypothetical protein
MNTIHHHPMPEKDTHNMLVLGEKTIFLSHLPMFHGNHAFQVILEGTFSSPGSDPQQIYTLDRRSHPKTKMYTLNPQEDFVLSDLFTPDPQRPARSSFKANVFRGHFEREGREQILTNIDVNTKRVVYSQKLPTAKKTSALKYLLFGKPEELFLAHFISKPPDFDQVLSVKIPGHNFTDEELSQQIFVTVAGKKNSPAVRIQENQQVSAKIELPGAPTLELQIQAGLELYFEEGELQSPPTFEQTPLEKKAGF